MKKLLSVAVALSLCASLAAPAFAMSFDEFQDIIDDEAEYDLLNQDADHRGYDEDEGGAYMEEQ